MFPFFIIEDFDTCLLQAKYTYIDKKKHVNNTV